MQNCVDMSTRGRTSGGGLDVWMRAPVSVVRDGRRTYLVRAINCVRRCANHSIFEISERSEEQVQLKLCLKKKSIHTSKLYLY